MAACALCATVLIAAHRRLPPIDSRRPADEAYVSVPPDDDDSKEQKSIAAAYSHAQVESFGQRWWKLLALFAAVALSIRVELYRELSHATECTIRSPEVGAAMLHDRRHTDCFQGFSSTHCCAL